MTKTVETRLVKQVLDTIEENKRKFNGYDVLDYEVVRREVDEDGFPEIEVRVYFQGYIGDEPDEDDIRTVNFISNDFEVRW